MTPCMDVYKENIQYDISTDKLKLRFAVRGEFQNKEIIVETWAPTASMTNLKYFLEDASKNKTIVQKKDFIGASLQANEKHRVFMKLDSIYGEYFPEYSNYFGRPLRINKSIYGITNYGNLFADELTNFLIYEAGFKQS